MEGILAFAKKNPNRIPPLGELFCITNHQEWKEHSENYFKAEGVHAD